LRSGAASWTVMISRETFTYRPDILAQLAEHGVRPRATTRPELVHELISDLYRYEIRRMRQRLIRGEFVRSEYFDRIVQLRRRYPLVSLKPHDFVE
jgi:hypothetical protein